MDLLLGQLLPEFSNFLIRLKRGGVLRLKSQAQATAWALPDSHFCLPDTAMAHGNEAVVYWRKYMA